MKKGSFRCIVFNHYHQPKKYSVLPYGEQFYQVEREFQPFKPFEPFETNRCRTEERKAINLAVFIYLDFPLDKGVGIWVAVDAEEEEPLALFVVAVVGVKNLQTQSTAMDKMWRKR